MATKSKVKVFLWFSEADVEKRLKELGIIEPTRAEIEKVVLSACSAACAWSSAYLQDLNKEELENVLAN